MKKLFILSAIFGFMTLYNFCKEDLKIVEVELSNSDIEYMDGLRLGEKYNDDIKIHLVEAGVRIPVKLNGEFDKKRNLMGEGLSFTVFDKRNNQTHNKVNYYTGNDFSDYQDEFNSFFEFYEIYSNKTSTVQFIINDKKSTMVSKFSYDNNDLFPEHLMIFCIKNDEVFFHNQDFLDNNISKFFQDFFSDIKSQQLELEDYFDLEYLSKLYSLKQLYKFNSSFIMSDNIHYLLNKNNMKIYPIIDDENIYNTTNEVVSDSFSVIINKLENNSKIINNSNYFIKKFSEFAEKKLKSSFSFVKSSVRSRFFSLYLPLKCFLYLKNFLILYGSGVSFSS